MNIQRKNSAHHFRMQSEREQTLVHLLHSDPVTSICISSPPCTNGDLLLCIFNIVTILERKKY